MHPVRFVGRIEKDHDDEDDGKKMKMFFSFTSLFSLVLLRCLWAMESMSFDSGWVWVLVSQNGWAWQSMEAGRVCDTYKSFFNVTIFIVCTTISFQTSSLALTMRPVAFSASSPQSR